ncbi:MAG TPA: NAD-dependent epimerase/dehydratase family protein [Gemmatimonadota bacterium]|nr:NAD-dependent epimerase/dehydratase family protein [Gemmatimonadota bacterium]
MRVFLTGATGFVGGHLAPALVEHGHEVSALVRPGSEGDGLERLGVRVVRGDVTDRRSMDAGMRGVDAVCHLATLRGGATAGEHRAVTVEGTENVLRAALNAGVGRVVHCSTVGVHGRLRRLPADESAPIRPGTAYQAAKAEAERVVMRYLRRHGLPIVILRPTAIYGPGDLRSLKLYRTILSGRLVTPGPADHPYHVVYVTDVVQALLRGMDAPDAPGEAYLVADGGPIPQIEMFRAIARAGGGELRRRRLPAWPFTLAAALTPTRSLGRRGSFTKSVHFFTHPRSFDISKARRDLGYRPEVDAEEGARRTLAWYRDQGLIPR